MRKNPRPPLAPDFDELVRIWLQRRDDFKLCAELSNVAPPHLRIWPEKRGYGCFAEVSPTHKRVVMYRRGFLDRPTDIAAMALVAETGLLDDYEIFETDEVTNELVPVGLTMRSLLSAIHEVQEESIVRHDPRSDLPDEPRTFKYLARYSPQEMEWYHATLASRVPSILKHGLLPSSLQEGRVEGWSPSWNFGLQPAVYLTAYEDRAARIAETLALRNAEPATLLVVDGAGLIDTKLLTYDEDALRNEFSSYPYYEHYDQAFPQWVTSAEHRGTESIAYLGRIGPSAIHPLATVRLVEHDGEVDLEWDDEQDRD